MVQQEKATSRKASLRAGYVAILIHASLILAAAALCTAVMGQAYQKRNRGESFHNVLSSNTTGSFNIWITATGIGHIWDDAPINLSTDPKEEGLDRLWVSNVRGFPQLKIQTGFFDMAMLTVDSRLLTWAFKPGWVAGALKLTWPNNKELRLHGVALDLKYQHNFTQGPPTLGGYIGFMPEGFVVMGPNFEGRLIYELDLLAKLSWLPVRVMVNGGIRVPFERDPAKTYQYLVDAGLVYSGYGFDFFATYSLEAFNNLTKPVVFTPPDGSKRMLIYFSENMSYLTLGGDVRYDNGIVLTAAVPLLLSLNQGSKMSRADQKRLDGKTGDFPEEESLDIRDPFDPWFVKWKIALSLTFPLRGKITSAEMMRNFLIMKNRKGGKKIDIDSRLRGLEEPSPEQKKVDEQEDAKRRLEEIRKRREQMNKGE